MVTALNNNNSILTGKTPREFKQVSFSNSRSIGRVFVNKLGSHLKVKNEKRLRSFSMSSYCVQLTKLLTSYGHIFDQQLAFHLLEVSRPIFYFALKPISINWRCSEHKCAFLRAIPFSWRATGIYINLGAIKKKSRNRFLPVNPHDLWWWLVTCIFNYYIFSPGPLWISISLLNGPS